MGPGERSSGQGRPSRVFWPKHKTFSRLIPLPSDLEPEGRTLGTGTGPQTRDGGDAPDHAPLGKHQLLGPRSVQPPAEKGTQLWGCTQSGDPTPRRPPQDRADGRRREGRSVEGQILDAKGKLSPLGSGASAWPRQGHSWQEAEGRRGWRRGRCRAQPGETVQVAAGHTSRPQRGRRSASRAPAPRPRRPWMGPTCSHRPRCLFPQPITSHDPRGRPPAVPHPVCSHGTGPAQDPCLHSACLLPPASCLHHSSAGSGRERTETAPQRDPTTRWPAHLCTPGSIPKLVPGLSGQQRRSRRLPRRQLTPTTSL